MRSVSAFRAYRKRYHDAIFPWKVAELLILDDDLPRSLHHCYEMVTSTLDLLAAGKRLECQRMAGQIYADLRFGKINGIFKDGLHEFLMNFVDESNELTAQLQRDFMMSLALA